MLELSFKMDMPDIGNVDISMKAETPEEMVAAIETAIKRVTLAKEVKKTSDEIIRMMNNTETKKSRRRKNG